MKHLEKSLEIFKRYLDNQPREHVEALVAKIDRQPTEGPTIDTYFEHLDAALDPEQWFGEWPSASKPPAGNWKFEALTRVEMETGSIAKIMASLLEGEESYVENSIHTAA